MQLAKWKRQILLFAAFNFATFAAIGCTVEAPKESPAETQSFNNLGGAGSKGLIGSQVQGDVPDSLPMCEPYRDMPDAYGFCVYKFGGGFPTVEVVNKLCPQAGDWEDECRHAWVAGRMHSEKQWPTEVLAKVCDGNVDCTFELIDFRADDDVLTQFRLCDQYTGEYKTDCAGHAMQRWWSANPTESEVLEISELTTPYSKKVGFYVALSQFCDKVGQCSDKGNSGRSCNNSLAALTAGKIGCPAKTKQKMHSSNRPADGSLKQGVHTPQPTPKKNHPGGHNVTGGPPPQQPEQRRRRQ